MPSSSTVRKRRTPAQREKILNAYRRSRLPQREFATRAGVGLSTLQLWLRKAASPPTDAPGFVQVPNLLSQPDPAPVYRVHLKSGVVVEIGAGFGSEQLAALLRLLPAG